MNIKNFLNPESVAIIGASNDRKKLGWQILNNLISGGFNGKIYPINLNDAQILGKKAYKSIELIKKKIDLAIIIIPAVHVADEVEKSAKIGIKNYIIISAGFGEIGDVGKKRENEIINLSNKYKLNILGPNCLGLINSNNNFNATFAKSKIKKGNIAFISQSGAIASAALDWSQDKSIGFSNFVSLGNEAILNQNDFFEYFIDDKDSKLIIAYLEKIEDGQKFMNNVSRLSKNKLVAILKGGKTIEGGQASLSHTGSLAGSAIAVKTGFKRAGVIELENLEEMFNLMILYQKNIILNNNNIFIISNAGGVLVNTTDLISSKKLNLGTLSDNTVKSLKDKLPFISNIYNPLDIIGDADAERYKIAIEIFLKDKKVTNLLILLTPQSSTEIDKTAEVISNLSNKYKNKNIFTIFIGGESLNKANKILQFNETPNFSYPEQLINVLEKIISRNFKPREYKYKKIEKISNKKNEVLDYLESFKLISKYKIPIIDTFKIEKEEDFNKFKYPIVIKKVGKQINHKIDSNAIFLDVKNREEGIKIFNDYIVNKNNSYLVAQPKINNDLELILGFKRDDSFGPIIMAGFGGTYTEIFNDICTEVDDINEERALNLLKDLKIFPILNGVRSKSIYDIKKITNILVKIGKIARENKNIQELDINPLIINENEIIAVDIRIII